MKTICYLAGGYPSIQKSSEIAALYLKGGCDAIEWSLPPRDPYIDPPYIADIMRLARAACDDYEVYLKQIENFHKEHPQAEIILLLYQETVEDLTPQRLVSFCRANGIQTILSGNLRDTALTQTLLDGGLEIAASMNYTMLPEELEMLSRSNGFVYLQAMPTPDDLQAGRGKETLKKAVETVRAMGIDRPIYCGVGIRKPEDIAFIKQSGGDGFFLGSLLIQYYNDPEKLVQTIQQFKQAGI